MTTLKYLIVSLLLPPGSLVLLAVLAGSYLWWRRQRLIAAAILGTAVLLWVASIAPTADLLMARLESPYYAIDTSARGDIIVLLGGGHDDDVSDLSGTGAPSAQTLTRLVTAARLHRLLDLPIVASGGRVLSDQQSEAELARRFLVDLGVPDEMVLVEGESSDTRENALYTQKICQRHGFKRPLLVTSAYHMGRSLDAFAHAGLKATPVAAGFFSAPGRRYGLTDFCPTASSLARLATALRENLGRVYYSLVLG